MQETQDRILPGDGRVVASAELVMITQSCDELKSVYQLKPLSYYSGQGEAVLRASSVRSGPSVKYKACSDCNRHEIKLDKIDALLYSSSTE